MKKSSPGGGLASHEVRNLWACLYLDQPQITGILETLRNETTNDFLHPLISLAAYTGMRRGELLRLRWSDVNFESMIVTARSRKQSRQKTETARDIPLAEPLAQTLHDLRARRPRGQFVHCRSGSTSPLMPDDAYDTFHRSLRGTIWDRELPGRKRKVVLGFHTFRHSFASNLAVSGVDQRVIDSMMGHQTEEMRKRYQHLFPSTRAAAVDLLRFESTSTAGETPT